MGAARTSAVTSERARRLTAYHEAGHALVGLLSPHADEIQKATIVPHGNALGMVVQLPNQVRTAALSKIRKSDVHDFLKTFDLSVQVLLGIYS